MSRSVPQVERLEDRIALDTSLDPLESIEQDKPRITLPGVPSAPPRIGDGPLTLPPRERIVPPTYRGTEDREMIGPPLGFMTEMGIYNFGVSDDEIMAFTWMYQKMREVPVPLPPGTFGPPAPPHITLPGGDLWTIPQITLPGLNKPPRELLPPPAES